jgi:glycerophosphoryl diester phosphodiesterase
MTRLASTPSGYNRRIFLGGSLALAAGALGCGFASDKRSPATVASLLAGDPFHIAHRGGGGDWPEMTAYAYSQAAAIPGLTSLEISVCLSADGVLVCSHDPTTERVTDVAYTIVEQDWDTLSSLSVTSRYTADPSQPSRPFTRFDEVVEAYIDRFVLFVEPKVPAAAEPLLAKMTSLNQPERVVWKQWISSPNFAAAKARGFATWGYVLDQPSHRGANLQRLVASPMVDLVGAPRDQPDAFVKAIVAAAQHNEKLTIMWNIRNDTDLRRALDLGCRGMMTSNPVEVLRR